MSLKRSIKCFSLFYKKNNIIRAEKIFYGIKIKEWNSLSEFKK
jgi:hypothetical protein